MKQVLSLLLIFGLCSGCTSRQQPAPTVDISPYGDASQPRTPGKFDLRGTKTHKVKSGDTLFSVAWQANLAVDTLARYNNLNPPYTINVGQILRLDKPRKVVIINKKPTRKKNVKKHSNQGVDLVKKQAYGESQGKVQNVVKPVVSGKANRTTFPSKVRQWLWPTKGTLIGRFSTKSNPNKGIDIAGKANAPIFATAAGKVVYTGNALKGYGNLVIIKHTENFLSAYAHNETLLVKEQQWIESGQQIATMGHNSEKGSHLHFEIRYKGKAVDPLRYLK